MEIIDNRAVRLKLRNPQRVTEVIPKSKVLDDGSVLVHFGLEEMQVLKNLAIKQVPSPISRTYPYPGLFKPYQHQKTTAEFLTLNRRAYVFSQAGTGKTSAAIWAADYLMELGFVTKVLIVCPISIMATAWQADIFHTAMHRKAVIAYGTKQKRLAALQSDAEFVITNYETVVNSLAEVKAAGFDLVIVDEANALKNSQSKRWKAHNELINRTIPNMWAWLMTGTPAAQSPVDAYGLAKLLTPSQVPRGFTTFRDMVMYKATMFKWSSKPEAKDVVFRTLQPAIRFTKDECLDLPDMVYTAKDIELTSQQQLYYNELKKDMIIRAAGEEISAANAAVALGKLIQIAGGAAYSTDKGVVEFDISNRYNALLEVLEETDRKVLISISYGHTIRMVKERLLADKHSVEVIDGSVSADKRADIIRRFQLEDTPRILILQPKAAAHGITLTRADTIVWWSPTSSVETYEQFNARAHRNGQSNKVTVVHFQSCAAERHLYSMLRRNVNVHQEIVNLYRQVVSS